MRLWLEKAGIFTSGWNINTSRLDEVTGISEHDIHSMAEFGEELNDDTGNGGEV